jgi:hypothetical protein
MSGSSENGNEYSASIKEGLIPWDQMPHEVRELEKSGPQYQPILIMPY